MDPRNCRFELVYQKAISQVEDMSFTTRSKERVSQSEKIQVNSHYDQSSFWQMCRALYKSNKQKVELPEEKQGLSEVKNTFCCIRLEHLVYY